MQDRVTDHRIPLSITGLENIMQGGENLDILANALEGLQTAERLDALAIDEQ